MSVNWSTHHELVEFVAKYCVVDSETGRCAEGRFSITTGKTRRQARKAAEIVFWDLDHHSVLTELQHRIEIAAEMGHPRVWVLAMRKASTHAVQSLTLDMDPLNYATTDEDERSAIANHAAPVQLAHGQVLIGLMQLVRDQGETIQNLHREGAEVMALAIGEKVRAEMMSESDDTARLAEAAKAFAPHIPAVIAAAGQFMGAGGRAAAEQVREAAGDVEPMSPSDEVTWHLQSMERQATALLAVCQRSPEAITDEHLVSIEQLKDYAQLLLSQLEAWKAAATDSASTDEETQEAFIDSSTGS